MRNHMKRFVVLPLFFGCASHSSVELGAPKRTEEDSKGSIVPRREEKDRSIITAKMKRSRFSSGNLVLAKPNVAAGIQRLIRGIKSLSLLFFYKEDIEMEPELEIGYPTDVKHVTHIGLDGSTTTHNNVKGWDNLKAPELLSLSPISFKQFELNMATQAHQSLINDPSSKYGG